MAEPAEANCADEYECRETTETADAGVLFTQMCCGFLYHTQINVV